MKIAFRISRMGFGGAERVFLSVASRLAQYSSFEVVFVVDMLKTGETEHLITKQGIRLIGLGCKRTTQSIIPLKRFIDHEQPDILISAYTDTNMAAVVSGKLAKHRCKVIVSEHASLEEHWQSASLKRKLILNSYVSFGYHFADHLLAVSQGIARQLINRGHKVKKVSCIYNPVRFSAQQTVIKLEQRANSNHIPNILAVGRITAQKDYLTLLKAFNLLIIKTKAKLTIVGGVHEVAEKKCLDAYLEANGLTDDVTFVGFTEAVDQYYLQADVFVLSSAWEGFGNVIVEALAFGLPVVSTNCNYGPAEILNNGEYGFLVPVKDLIALACALDKAIESRSSCDVSRLQRRAAEFSEEKIATEYSELFRYLAGGAE